MEEDIVNEYSLRPLKLSEYIGQEKVKDNLKVFIKAAQLREESLDHVILHGPPGLGKTTLANIIAREMGGTLKITSGPAIEKAGDLASILTTLTDKDVLFIDVQNCGRDSLPGHGRLLLGYCHRKRCSGEVHPTGFSKIHADWRNHTDWSSDLTASGPFWCSAFHGVL